MEYLGEIFLALFVLAFLFTLAALGGLVQVQEKYKDWLFRGIFVGGIFLVGLVFKKRFLDPQPSYATLIEPSDGWMAYNLESQQIFQPFAKSTKDGIVMDSISIGKSEKDAGLNLKNQVLDIKLEDKNSNIFITNDNDLTLGYIPLDHFRKNDFFNDIKKIEKRSNYAEITFKKNARERWYKSRGRSLQGFPYEIEMDREGKGAYALKSIAQDTILPSTNLNSSSRDLQFFYSDPNSPSQSFYLFYIDSAVDTHQVQVTKNYVRFVQIKIEPEMKTPH